MQLICMTAKLSRINYEQSENVSSSTCCVDLWFKLDRLWSITFFDDEEKQKWGWKIIHSIISIHIFKLTPSIMVLAELALS